MSLPMNPFLRRVVNNSSLLFATNPETASVLSKSGARDVRMLLDTGTAVTLGPIFDYNPPVQVALELLWAGRMEPRKGLSLALEALALLPDVPVHLRVAGDGLFRKEFEAHAKTLNLEDRVTFLGHVEWEHMEDVMKGVHAFVFTSLQDSSGSVVLEAMAHSRPVIVLAHQGIGYFVPESAGIKVPVTSPSETVSRLADAIRMMYTNPETRTEMARAAWEFADSQRWDKRAEAMSNLYKGLVSGTL